MHVRLPLLAILIACSTAVPARAEPAPDERTVELVVAGTREEASAIAEVVGELLRRFELRLRAARVERLDVATVATPDPAAPPAVARVWIDLAPPVSNNGVWQTEIYVVDGSWERTRIRRVAVLGGVDEVAREEIAHAVASGVEGAVSGQRLDMSCDQLRIELGLPPADPTAEEPDDDVPPPPRPEPLTPTPPPGDEFAFDLSLGYEVTGFADEAAVSHGPIATLELALRQAWLRPALGFTMQYRLPLEVEASPFGVRLDQGLFRLMASVAVPIATGLRFVVQLGGGIDVVWTAPRTAAGETARPAAASTAYFGVVRAGIGLRVTLGGSFALLALVGCDIDGRHRTYVSYDEGLRQMVLEPWTVRPQATVTFAFDLLDPLGSQEPPTE